MFQTVSTNAAGILTIILMWSTLVWALTYMYMGSKVTELRKTIEVLDWHIYESDLKVASFIEEREWIERVYGHVLDDYTDHYYEPMFDMGAEYEIQDNGSWKRVN